MDSYEVTLTFYLLPRVSERKKLISFISSGILSRERREAHSRERIPPLRPIVDTIGSTHYGVGKFISKLLHPLTQNQYHLKDSFDAAEKISGIPRQLYDDGYRFVSFDVKSLFTNVPLNKTIEIILDRVYNKKVISTALKKQTLKKLMKDTCSKTAFMYDGIIYEQIDGVSMGAALGPVLANIIMTEMERVVVDQLIQSGKIKFYAKYVDDILHLVKPDDIDDILQRFNNFHRNIEFTVHGLLNTLHGRICCRKWFLLRG